MPSARFLVSNITLVAALSSCAERPRAASKEEPASVPAVASSEPAAVASAPAPASADVPDAAPAPAPKTELTTTRFAAYVWEHPRFDSFVMGYFRAGARVTRLAEPVLPGPNVGACPGKWWRIEPVGYVCEGKEGVTSDVDSPAATILARYQPKRDEPLPYGYGMSMSTPMYGRVPTVAEQKQVEGDVDAYRKQVAEARAKTAPDKLWPEVAIPIEPMPSFLENGAQAPSILAWAPQGKVLKASYAVYQTRLGIVAAFDVGDRPFYLTTESFLVPADRLRASKLSDFHGVELAKPGEGGVHLPLAWVRFGAIPIFKLDGDKASPTELKLPHQGHAEIAPDKPMNVRGTTFVEIAHPDSVLGTSAESGARYLLKASDITRLDVALAKDKPEKVGDDEVWVDVSLSKQTLILYRGMVPVYTTLVSTGAGKNHDTPSGTFRIYAKHVTSRMSAEEKPSETEGEEPEKAYRYDDVPYVQYLFEGIAFHAAFWHEGFGQVRSHGCINLAPRDAVWLFHHTLPEVPEGWHGINAGRGGVPLGTTVVIHY